MRRTLHGFVGLRKDKSGTDPEEPMKWLDAAPTGRPKRAQE
jgi:hypothetical protein